MSSGDSIRDSGFGDGAPGWVLTDATGITSTTLFYQKLLDIWEDEAPGTVLYDPHEFYGVNNSVNWSPYSFYYMDFRAYNLSFSE